MTEHRLDEVELRSELALAVEEALELADQLAVAVIEGRASIPLAARLAHDFQQKRLEIRRLRRALKVEIAG